MSLARQLALFVELLRTGYAAFVEATDVLEQLRALNRFRLLSPHRKGPTGTVALNRLAEEALRKHSGSMQALQYVGRPIIVTENDYQMELFNGDVGVIAPSTSGRHLAAFFEQRGQMREVQTARLPAHESVYVMTVHKSQGSEFDEVALVLPEVNSPVFTRELLYTAVTRARHAVTLVGTEAVLMDGLNTRIQRASGLREALWGTA
jgi:exodeoxyribonuclease V alpha subunit